MKQIKGLELISLADLDAVWLELSVWSQRYQCKRRRPSKTKEINQSDTKKLRSVHMNLVHFCKERTNWWAQQHQKAQKTTKITNVGDSWTLSLEDKPLPDVETSQEFSRKSINRRFQESKHRVFDKLQTTGNIQEQEGPIILCQKASKTNQLLDSDLWTDETKIILHQNDG